MSEIVNLISSKSGHRSRMREKLINMGGGALLDYELLEVLLFTSISRRDVRAIAKTLISHCGGRLTNVFWADPIHLRRVAGVSDATIATIICVRSILERALRINTQLKPVTNNWGEVIDYLRLTTKHSIREYLRVLYLNQKNIIIHDALTASGTVDRVSIYGREIIKQALDIGAISIVISHNHISGDPRPSEADMTITEQLIESCRAIGVRFIDHIIISDSKHFSFREQGLL